MSKNILQLVFTGSITNTSYLLSPSIFLQELPKTLRGVVLGLAAYCPGSKYMKKPPTVLSGALCIVFDTEALGIAGALARVFKRV